MANDQPIVAIGGVEIVSQSDMGVMCRVDGRLIWIGGLQMPAGLRPPPVGFGRTLVMFKSAAHELGVIVDDDSTHDRSQSGSPLAWRILVVDNHADNAESLALLFSRDDRVVETTASGREAIARAIKWRPHLIVLDLGLPDLSGEEVAAALRSAGSTAHIVAYSGYHTRQGSAMAAGCNTFLLKPQLEALLTIADSMSQKATG
jgi:CheY-like chemotaxis protein